MKIITPHELYQLIVGEHALVGKTGSIQLILNNYAVNVRQKDAIGNLLQEWFIHWLQHLGIHFETNPNTQSFPDIFLDPADRKNNLLEIKTFDEDRGPGFDLANFESYCKTLETDAYRLDCYYLIISYKMLGTSLLISNIWLKNIWEISGASSTYPVKVQEKKKIIYNLRPITWFSDRSKYKPFATKEQFLTALNETRYQYSVTHHNNSHWLNNVIKNYAKHTGAILSVKRAE